MKYSKMPYKEKLQHQECICIVSSQFRDVFHVTVKTPNGDKNVRINIGCDCFKGGNRQLNKKMLCTHEVTALKKLLEDNEKC